MIVSAEQVEEEKVRTLHPSGKEGVLMPKSVYDSICSSIVSVLYIHHQLSFSDLLEKCQQNTCIHPVEISWLILQVKLDLEARGLVKSVVPAGQRVMMQIKLTRSGKHQLPFEFRKNILNEIKLNKKNEMMNLSRSFTKGIVQSKTQKINYNGK